MQLNHEAYQTQAIKSIKVAGQPTEVDAVYFVAPWLKGRSI